MTDDADWRAKLEALMWAGDVDALQSFAPCACCCGEHTFLWCEARYWGGCRSGYGPGESLEDELPAWRALYPHLADDEFYGERMQDDADLRAEAPWSAELREALQDTARRPR